MKVDLWVVVTCEEGFHPDDIREPIYSWPARGLRPQDAIPVGPWEPMAITANDQVQLSLVWKRPYRRILSDLEVLGKIAEPTIEEDVHGLISACHQLLRNLVE